MCFGIFFLQKDVPFGSRKKTGCRNPLRSGATLCIKNKSGSPAEQQKNAVQKPAPLRSTLLRMF